MEDDSCWQGRPCRGRGPLSPRFASFAGPDVVVGCETLKIYIVDSIRNPLLARVGGCKSGLIEPEAQGWQPIFL